MFCLFAQLPLPSLTHRIRTGPWVPIPWQLLCLSDPGPLQIQGGTATLGNSQAVSCKLNSIYLSYDPAIPLYVTYPREMEACVHTKTCTWIFIGALSTIAPNWMEPKRSSADAWINKLWHVHVMDYYTAIKRNGLPIRHVTMCKI